MGKYLIKLDGREGSFYLEWSTVVDAPITTGMSLDELREYIKEEYGQQGTRHLDERLTHLDQKGTSAFDQPDLDSVIGFNRAGPNEGHLSKRQLYLSHCLMKPIRFKKQQWYMDATDGYKWKVLETEPA